MSLDELQPVSQDHIHGKTAASGIVYGVAFQQSE